MAAFILKWQSWVAAMDYMTCKAENVYYLPFIEKNPKFSWKTLLEAWKKRISASFALREECIYIKEL